MYIVFGSSGFLGKNLISHLKKKYGKNKIICVSRKKNSFCKLFKKIDLSKDKLESNVSIQNIKTAFILSAASQVIVSNKVKEIEQIKTNKFIISNIIKILKKKNVKNIVYFNSSSVYSSINKKPFSESQKLKPTISLGKSKLYGERKLSKFCKTKGINFISLRIFTVYGPGMGKHQFIYQAIKKFFLRKKKLTFWNENTKRSFIYVTDLIKIIDLIINNNKQKNLIINVGSYQLTTVSNVINLISDITKIKKSITYLKSKNSLDHIPDLSKLKKIIKNFHFTSLEKGLRKTINDF